MPSSRSELSLAGKAGIITGALGGIGRRMSETFAEAGARVALFDLDGDAATRAAAGLGEGHIGIGVDIGDPGQVRSAVAEAARTFGAVDYLVNNAAIRSELSFLDQDLESWNRTLAVNLTGAFLCAQEAARVMIGQGGGKIVNIASAAGLSAVNNRSSYIASKAGLIGLTRSIAWELGGKGVYCNAIAPGVTETPLTAHYFDRPELAKLIRDNTPLERWAQPDDMAGPALFLCSAASNYIQGQVLVVDGGWLAGKGF